MRGRRIQLALCTLMLASAASANEPLDRVLERMDDADLSVRERAHNELLALDGISLATIESALINNELSPEQRQRLLRAARALFRQMPKAGLGVSFGRAEGVTIASTVQNGRFPAADVLQPNDRILSIDGMVMVDTNQMRSIILARLPGEVLDAVVERGNQVLEIELPLGRFEDLDTARLDEATIAGAFNERLRITGATGDRNDTIGESLGAADWVAAERGRSESMVTQRIRTGPRVSMGGEPRSWTDRIWWVRATGYRDGQIGIGSAASDDSAVILETLAKLNTREVDLEMRLTQLDQEAATPDLTPEQQTELQERRRRIREELSLIEAQSELLRSMLRRP